MTDRELFTKSHEALIDLMSWVNKPIILVERGAVDNDALRSFEKGNIVFNNRRLRCPCNKRNSLYVTLLSNTQLVRKISKKLSSCIRKRLIYTC